MDVQAVDDKTDDEVSAARRKRSEGKRYNPRTAAYVPPHVYREEGQGQGGGGEEEEEREGGRDCPDEPQSPGQKRRASHRHVETEFARRPRSIVDLHSEYKHKVEVEIRSQDIRNLKHKLSGWSIDDENNIAVRNDYPREDLEQLVYEFGQEFLTETGVTLQFPCYLSHEERRRLHIASEDLDIKSRSKGTGSARFLMLCSRDLADAGEADRLTRNLDASDQELSDYLYELAHSKGLDVLSEKDPKLFDACCLVRRVDAAIEAILEGNESQLLEMIEQSGDKMLNAKSLRYAYRMPPRIMRQEGESSTPLVKLSGADLSRRKKQGGLYLIHAAVACNKPALVGYLISKGKALQGLDYKRQTALDVAEVFGYTQIAEALERAGCTRRFTAPRREDRW